MYVNPETVFVATKIGTATLSADETVREFEGSLKRLQMERVDILYLHRR